MGISFSIHLNNNSSPLKKKLSSPLIKKQLCFPNQSQKPQNFELPYNKQGGKIMSTIKPISEKLTNLWIKKIL